MIHIFLFVITIVKLKQAAKIRLADEQVRDENGRSVQSSEDFKKAKNFSLHAQ